MIDPKKILLDVKIDPETRRLVDAFISPESIGRRYLFGRNEHSATLSKVINIDGFVDDFAERNSIWEGKPVLNGNDVPDQAIVVNCVMCARPITALKRIQELRIMGVLAYSDLCNALSDLVPLPKFVSETRSDIQRHLNKWQMLRSSLYDDQSKIILDDVLKFLLTGNYTTMIKYSFRPKDQYFEDFLEISSKAVFVDGGGFDGDTTELFIRKYPEYKEVFLFEPSLSNMEKARIRLKGCHSIKFIPLGLSNSIGKIWFDPDEGSTSGSISEYGSCQIDITTIDRYVKSKVTLIKLDIEGWEMKALQGATRHIMNDHPKLAIAVYHKPSDFWNVYEFVISMRQDYNIFLRHYTEGWSETVMYFVPK